MFAPDDRERPFEDIVLVVDRRASDSDRAPHFRRDLEMTDETTLNELLNAFAVLDLRVHIYGNPRALSEHASRHTRDLVWSLYGGEASRNRLALVPAICEAHGLRYIGPDVYGHIICHDKDISKTLARSCRLATPRWNIVRAPGDLAAISLSNPPFVVKPLLEGSSIGISQRNLVHDQDEAVDLILEMLKTFAQPVMVEEFARGREVSYNWIAARPSPLWSFSEIRVEGKDNYFDSHLFDADEKVHRRLTRAVYTIDDLLGADDRAKLDGFIQAVGEIAYCRIDGKFDDGRFVFIEATPDAHLSPAAAFAASFINRGWEYPRIIEAVIHAAIRGLRDRSTNGLGKEDGSRNVLETRIVDENLG